MPFKPVPVEITERAIEYFWERVDQSPHPKGCWIWTGSKRGNGQERYGVINVGKHRPGAHRFSWTLHNGPIPKGFDILHDCDNPRCVNPAHLCAGTHQQNMSERDYRGRGFKPLGELSPLHTLTADQVRVIKMRIRDGLSDKEIAVDYPVSHFAIREIRAGRNWKHIDIDEQRESAGGGDAV
jgi:hypothetical protein